MHCCAHRSGGETEQAPACALGAHRWRGRARMEDPGPSDGHALAWPCSRGDAGRGLEGSERTSASLPREPGRLWSQSIVTRYLGLGGLLSTAMPGLLYCPHMAHGSPESCSKHLLVFPRCPRTETGLTLPVLARPILPRWSTPLPSRSSQCHLSSRTSSRRGSSS